MIEALVLAVHEHFILALQKSGLKDRNLSSGQPSCIGHVKNKYVFLSVKSVDE
jgi:hypothetical protein